MSVLDQIKLLLFAETNPVPAPISTSVAIIKPKGRYISVNQILQLFNFTKAQYNNLLSDVRFVVLSMQVDFNIPFKSQDTVMIARIIEKVKYHYYYLIV